MNEIINLENEEDVNFNISDLFIKKLEIYANLPTQVDNFNFLEF